MVYHYRTVICPNCGKLIEKTRTVDSQFLQGSPFRTCPYCNQTYFDKEYKEMGIELFTDKGGTIKLSTIGVFLVSNGALIVFVYLAIIDAIAQGFHPFFLIPIVMFGTLSLIVDIGIIDTIYCRVHIKEHNQRKIDYIEGRGRERTSEVIESMNRLSNKDYLDALVRHGVYVPEYFFNRLNH